MNEIKFYKLWRINEFVVIGENTIYSIHYIHSEKLFSFYCDRFTNKSNEFFK